MKGKTITLIAVLTLSLFTGGVAALDETQMQSTGSTVNVTEDVVNNTVTVTVDTDDIDAANQTGVTETSTDVYDVTIQHNGVTSTGTIDVANTSSTEVDVSSFSGNATLYVPDPTTTVKSGGDTLFGGSGGGLLGGGNTGTTVVALMAAVGAFLLIRD